MTTEEQDDKELEIDEQSASSADDSPQGNEQEPEDSQQETTGEDGASKRREALIAELTGATPEDKDDEDEPAEEDEDGSAEAELPDESEEEDDELSDEDMAKLKRRTRKRIEYFRTKVAEAKEREPLANYGQEIIAFAKEHEIKPDDLSNWIGLAAVVNKGGQPAVDALLNVAKSLGYQPPTTPPQEHKKQDGALPDWLQAKVDSFDIDLEVAKEIASKLPASAPAQAPASAPQPFAAAAPAAPQTSAPAGQGYSQQDLDRGAQQLETLIAEANAKYPADWEKRIYPQVRAKMAEFRGAPVDQWPRLFKLALESTVANIRTPAKQSRPAISPGAGTSTQGGSRAKSPRERMIAKLTGG